MADIDKDPDGRTKKRPMLSLKATETGWMVVEGDRAVLATLPTLAEAEEFMGRMELYLADLVYRTRVDCVSDIRYRMDAAWRDVYGGDFRGVSFLGYADAQRRPRERGSDG